MADSDHTYSRGDRAALILLGAGKCYWPTCTEPLLTRTDDGKFRIALQIAHIRAAKPDGQRYVPDMDPAVRKSFDNLIFLCVPHHQAVDEKGGEEKYPAETLQEWKEIRESGRFQALRGLRDLTEDRLQDMIATATRERDEDIKRTLDRLERSDAEAAGLLRELRDEVKAREGRRSALDVDAVYALARAADQLRHLEENAGSLNRAADGLRGLEDRAASIVNAVAKLNAAQDTVSELSVALGKLGGLRDDLALMRSTADAVERASRRMEDYGRRY
ncbi:hypothetical protein [Saccharothrix hoggarensis]|uniref:HNH endonuclease n=1 Tax=Saccharothrix hoggarensis TaxID=913853 RepID=A0ABW3QRD2_9PSEU